jgi:hypothetical protein
MKEGADLDVKQVFAGLLEEDEVEDFGDGEELHGVREDDGDDEAHLHHVRQRSVLYTNVTQALQLAIK